VQLTIRARLTILYFAVLAASFFAFFWICDFGFQRSIETTVNDASRGNLESVRKVIEASLPQGMPKVQQELTQLSSLWPTARSFRLPTLMGSGCFVRLVSCRRSSLCPQFRPPAFRSSPTILKCANTKLPGNVY
jgi:hypothetical protein